MPEQKKLCTLFYPKGTDSRLVDFLAREIEGRGYEIQDWEKLAKPSDLIVSQLQEAIRVSSRVVAVLHPRDGEYNHNLFYEAGYTQGYQAGIHPAPGPILIMVAREDVLARAPIYAKAYPIATYRAENELETEAGFRTVLHQFLTPLPPEQHEFWWTQCNTNLRSVYLQASERLNRVVTSVFNKTEERKHEEDIMSGLKAVTAAVSKAERLMRSVCDRDPKDLQGEVRGELKRKLEALDADRLNQPHAFRAHAELLQRRVDWIEYLVMSARAVNQHPGLSVVAMLMASVAAVLLWTGMTFVIVNRTEFEPMGSIWGRYGPTTGVVLSWLLVACAYGVFRAWRLRTKSVSVIASCIVLAVWSFNSMEPHPNWSRFTMTFSGLALSLLFVPKTHRIFAGRVSTILQSLPGALLVTLIFAFLSHVILDRTSDIEPSSLLWEAGLRGAAVGLTFLAATVVYAVPPRLRPEPDDEASDGTV